MCSAYFSVFLLPRKKLTVDILLLLANIMTGKPQRYFYNWHVMLFYFKGSSLKKTKRENAMDEKKIFNVCKYFS